MLLIASDFSVSLQGHEVQAIGYINDLSGQVARGQARILATFLS